MKLVDLRISIFEPWNVQRLVVEHLNAEHEKDGLEVARGKKKLRRRGCCCQRVWQWRLETLGGRGQRWLRV